jgi:hypothetical protein
MRHTTQQPDTEYSGVKFGAEFTASKTWSLVCIKQV